MARECATILMERWDEAPLKIFKDILGHRLAAIICDSLAVTRHTPSKRQEKLWTLFFSFRSCELSRLWKDLLLQMKLPRRFEDPWLVQVVSRRALEELVRIKYPAATSASEDPKHLTADEHNALRYAAGYVLLSLKRKFASTNPSLAAWIEQQTDTSATFAGGSYTQFTKAWVEKVNRGGLFLVSDCIYEVFLAIELVLRQFLKTMSDDHGLDRDKVVAILQDDNEVQFHWSMITFDIDDDSSQNILKDMIKLWITIRGFRYASTIVEEYKRLNAIYLRRIKSLRKELKKQTLDSNQ